MKKIIITLLFLFTTTLNLSATTLPVKLSEYIKEQFPRATIRFDGLITLSDKTTYVPLIPAIEAPVQNIEISYAYPNNSNLKKKAEILVFNNNYVLLKLIKTKNGITISKDTNYPIAVKAGMLPQDLLVPKGFYIPESLEGILGDLKIPIGTKNDTIIKKTDEFIVDEVTDFLDKKIPITIPKISALKNKLYFVTNYDSNFIRVINSDDTQPLYSLKLESIPRSIVPVSNNKYLMITTGAKTYVDIVDIQREEIAKQIDLTIEPSEIVVDDKNNLAYISAKNEEALFIIDTKTMELKRKVLIKGISTHMVISDDGKKIVYQDKNTARLYVLYPQENFKTLKLTVIPNVSKIIATNVAVYAISRTKNTLDVLSYPVDNNEKILETPEKFSFVWDGPNDNLPSPIQNLILAKKNISKKPVDMLLFDEKLYILSAEENNLNIYDIKTNEIIKKIDLPIGGFSKKITQVDKTNYIVISNAIEEKYLIFDMKTNSTIQQVPINTKINNLVILEKSNTKLQSSGKETL